MTERNRYLELMRRYFDAGTSATEEQELARYAAVSEDPDFEVLRGVLGYLSVGRGLSAGMEQSVDPGQVVEPRQGVGQERSSGGKRLRFGRPAAIVAAACVAVAVMAGLSHSISGGRHVQYVFAEKSTDGAKIMQTVEASLSEFFSHESGAEVQLAEIFNR